MTIAQMWGRGIALYKTRQSPKKKSSDAEEQKSPEGSFNDLMELLRGHSPQSKGKRQQCLYHEGAAKEYYPTQHQRFPFACDDSSGLLGTEHFLKKQMTRNPGNESAYDKGQNSSDGDGELDGRIDPLYGKDKACHQCEAQRSCEFDNSNEIPVMLGQLHNLI